jgi:alkylation response protein AidB-like acyl-CoA dehydrogenase
MEFDFTEEQRALQDTLLKFIARDYDFEKRRGFVRSATGYSPAAWSQYAELGLLSLPLPEAYGGLAGGGIDVMVVMELIGQGLLLEPYLSTVVTCGGLIRDSASDAQKAALLPRIGEGHLQIALAAYEAAGRYELARVECKAEMQGSSWRLSGRKSVVVDGASAQYFLVSARSAGKSGERDGISIFLVPREAPGVAVSTYPTQSGGRAADLQLQNVTLDGDALIGAAGSGLAIVERAVDHACAALCAEAVGIMNALNLATLNYLKTRKQFGVAIGTFQALKHRMAEMLMAAEQSRSMAIIAAVHTDSADAATRRRAVSAAKAYIGQAARLVGQQAVQMHGGMGVVDDLIISHYFKRLTIIDLTYGDVDHHLAYFSGTLLPVVTALPAA